MCYLEFVIDCIDQIMKDLRDSTFSLICHLVGGVPQGLLQELLMNCDGELKTEVVQSAAFFEHRLQNGQKAIYHLEAFVARFMAIYKRFLEEGIADLF